jgi:hypothetical protein
MKKVTAEEIIDNIPDCVIKGYNGRTNRMKVDFIPTRNRVYLAREYVTVVEVKEELANLLCSPESLTKRGVRALLKQLG